MRSTGERTLGRQPWAGAPVGDWRLNGPQTVIALLLLLSALSPARAEPEDEEIPRPPAIGRPEHFDEDESPIGSFHTPTVQAEPRTLQVEDPLTFTVRIVAGSGRVWRPPSRPKLGEFAGFPERFYIDSLGDASGRRVDERTWEFAYTLRPKRADVKSIPSFPFVFFTPGFIPPEKGYQIKRTTSIDLSVCPRAAVQPVDVKTDQPPARAPDAIYQFAEGRQVLRQQSAWPLDHLLIITAIGLLLPPALCLVWCVIWRRLNPDAARRAKQRRSQAARQALHALRAAALALGAGLPTPPPAGPAGSGDPRRAPGDPAQKTASIVTEYLRQRLDLASAEPTPGEVGGLLARAGFAPKLVGEAAEFFRACDAVRFAPASATRPDELHGAATQLILSLEAESWPAPTS